MKYKNVNTGCVIDTPCEIKGQYWIPIIENKKLTSAEKPAPKKAEAAEKPAPKKSKAK